MLLGSWSFYLCSCWSACCAIGWQAELWAWTGEWLSMAEDLKRAVLLEQSVEIAAMRQNSCWMCVVTEEGDMLCGKVVAAMWMLPHMIKF